MKILYLFTLALSLLAAAVFPAKATFSSLYVFGDGLSATADTVYPSPGYPLYYNLRWSNGRVWVEVLAQRQNIPINYNNSYFDHNSSLTVADVNNFTAPADVANDLFILWVCNADTFDAATTVVNDNTSTDYNYLLNLFTSANSQSQANHLQIINTLYAKGVRTLIMPNAVDISTIPAYNTGSKTAVLHAGCIDYNTKYFSAISQARALHPDLKIYTPDFYTLLNNVLANPGYYGLVNALSGGFSIDALDDPSLPQPVDFNGPGANYIFWDPQDPTAKFHAVIADVTQQIVSPAYISKYTPLLNSGLVGSNRLDVVNMPVGLSGFVDGGTNLVLSTWGVKIGFASTNQTQSLFVPVNNPSTQRYYRLRFPYAWSWP